MICSDETTAELNKDEFVGGAYELGIETTTDPERIKKFLSNGNSKKKVIFVTYQSGRRLIDAASETGFRFDPTIMDEAHKTVGYTCEATGASGGEDGYFLHLMEDIQIWETVDPETMQAVGAGQRGLSVCTNLASESSPQLRFLVGDFTTLNY